MRASALESKTVISHKERLDQNQKIITLIRSKLLPLAKDKHGTMFPPIKLASLHDSPSPAKREATFEICVQFPEYTIHEHHPLVEKAKGFLKSEKISEGIEANRPRLDMNKYLSLFETEGNKQNEEMNKIRKEAEGFGKEKSYFLTDPDEHRESEHFSQENSSLLNARIRKRLNHRKLIAMHRG